MMHLNPIKRRDVLAGASIALIGAVAGSAAAQSGSETPQPALPPDRLRVAFIVDEGANMIDLAGAWEVFQDARVDKERQGDKAFYLYAVAPERKLYHTTGNGPGSGLPFMPNYTLSEAPVPDVIFMGAQGNSPDGEKPAWIRHHAPQAKIVMSVCVGTFLLARTGLIDGKRATTHHEYFERFARSFPHVQLVRNRRFVDNGKFVTGGGLTAGIDSALHVVSRLIGPEQARATAN